MFLSPLMEIIARTARDYGLTIKELTGPSTTPRLIGPRQEAYYRCYVSDLAPNLTAIGRRFNNRDHQTIDHGIRRHCERIGIPPPASLGNRKARSPKVMPSVRPPTVAPSVVLATADTR